MAAKSFQPDCEINVVRLKNRADFLKARNGARSHERAFVLQLHTRSQDTGSALRVGFTVTKKVGNAVERNRIKRRLRAAIELAELPASCAGKDAVIIARRAALTQPFQQLVDDVSNSFTRAKTPFKRNSKPHIAN